MDSSQSSLIDAYLTEDHVILSRGKSSVWCCKKSGDMLLNGSEFHPSHIESPGPVYLGKIWGCIGKLRFFTDGEWKLLLITKASCVGTLPQGGKVFCVEKIGIIPLTTDSSVETFGIENPDRSVEVAASLTTTVALPGVVELGIELNEVASGSGSFSGPSFGRPPSPTFKEKFLNFVGESEKSKELRDREKVEKRLTEALLWMFNDSQSFYFSTNFDLTQPLQRKSEQPSNEQQLPLWQMVDEQFFWNKWMLSDLTQKNYQGEMSDPWILPLIQGYVEIREVAITTHHAPDILQSGWNSRYAEKRSSLSAIEIDGALKLVSTATILKEDALKDDELGSGYETDSESGEDSEDSKHILDDSREEAIKEEPEMEELKTESNNEEESKPETQIKEEPDSAPPPDSNGITIVIDKSSSTAVDDPQSAAADEPLSDRGRLEIESLSSLCKTVLKESGGEIEQNDRLGIQAVRLRPDSAELSNFDSDYFANSSHHASEEEEGWVAVGKDEAKREDGNKRPTSFTLAIISRRSRHRAGTRYRRRGVDENGHVANHVETEMLAQCGSHVVSYVIMRGSVPVYWTQPGYKYRPPPVIQRSDEDTQEAFQKHFDRELQLYQEMIVVNLVKQLGKEKILSDAYEKHILLMNNPKVTYIVFDFHHHFKNNQSVALKQLLKKTQGILRSMRFCWLDTDQPGSVLCRQESVFRVNCMDCLDRTNVMQSIFTREVLQSALHKLGIIPFEEKLDGAMLISFKEMWGNNGDIVSKQYTGTIAMKGDITRYGERKLAGMMKDGYNSAHRYYMNIFRDSYRQVLIDLMQGVNPAEASTSLPNSMKVDELDDGQLDPSQAPPIKRVTASSVREDDEEQEPIGLLDREEAVMDIVQHCKNELFPNKSLHLQSWALMEAAGHSFVSSSHKEELCILIQCRETSQLTFVNYDLELEQIVCLMRIPMSSIQQIVIGPLGMYLRSSRRLHMRIYYSFLDDNISYFTLRTVPSRPSDMDRAILLSIADALAFLQPDITVAEHKLTKKKSPEHQGVVYLIVPKTFLKSLDEEVSHDMHAEKSRDHMISVEQTEEGIRSDSELEVNQFPSQSNHTRPLNERSQSFDDILSTTHTETTLSPARLAVPTVTVSPSPHSTDPSSDDTQSRNAMHQVYSDSSISSREPSPALGEKDRVSDSKNGSLKRASSDTMLSSKESDALGRLTRFTGRLFQNLLSVGRPKKSSSSSSKPNRLRVELNDAPLPPMRTDTETNDDSDTSLSKWPRRFQQRFKKTGASWSNPESDEDETKKREMRARSKTKIIIV